MEKNYVGFSYPLTITNFEEWVHIISYLKGPNTQTVNQICSVDFIFFLTNFNFARIFFGLRLSIGSNSNVKNSWNSFELKTGLKTSNYRRTQVHHLMPKSNFDLILTQFRTFSSKNVPKLGTKIQKNQTITKPQIPNKTLEFCCDLAKKKI